MPPEDDAAQIHQENAPIIPYTVEELADAFVECFAGKRGTILLSWLHATARTRRSAFTPGPGGSCDPYLAAKRDGAATLVWTIEEKLAIARAHHAGKPPAAPAAVGGNPAPPGRKRATRRKGG